MPRPVHPGRAAHPTRVALLGLPTDVNSSYVRGAARAPGEIRKALWCPSSNLASETGVDLGTPGLLTDEGDLALQEEPGDRARIETAVSALIARGATPLLLGGDHSVTYPVVRALAATHRKLSILHFDAHPDLYDRYDDNPLSHASPFARIMERRLATRLVQVGVRTWNRHQREQAARFGVEVVGWDDFSPARVPIPDAPLYVTIDLDGLDPAFAPAVWHPEPGGLSIRDIVGVLARIRCRVVGGDVVELNPSGDIGDTTAIAAVKLMKEMAAAMARGQGN
jgi:arginase